ncbi:MAG: hypothetical protein AAF485_11745 [Chloroflexota bacterium]
MPLITPEQFQDLLPLAAVWAEAQETLILQQGVPLTTAQLEDAQQVGVRQPEQIRLLSVDKIPLPDHPALRAAAQATQLISPYASGVTFRYGIFIRAREWGERSLIVHELVHTAQYERLGGFEPFLAQYLMECLTVGYPEAPMEQEAIRVAREICGESWPANFE